MLWGGYRLKLSISPDSPEKQSRKDPGLRKNLIPAVPEARRPRVCCWQQENRLVCDTSDLHPKKLLWQGHWESAGAGGRLRPLRRKGHHG